MIIFLVRNIIYINHRNLLKLKIQTLITKSNNIKIRILGIYFINIQYKCMIYGKTNNKHDMYNKRVIASQTQV